MAIRKFHIFSLLLLTYLLACDSNKHSSANGIFDNCKGDDFALALKKLVYAELIHSITMDTVFIVNDQIALYDTIPYYKSSLDYFMSELPVQIDTGKTNVEIINAKDPIRCLSAMKLENIVFQNITEKELSAKKILGRKNYYFRFTDIKLFKKEGVFGLVVQRINKTFQKNNYFLFDKKNHKVLKMSNQLE